MMVQRTDDSRIDEDAPLDPDGDDDRLGEAIEQYLALVEQDQPPDVDEFVARYPGLEDDIREALGGLELIHGLVGHGSSPVSGSGHGKGSGRWLESGRRIAGYRVVRELGRGGMGTVYEAVHVGLDRPVALKVLGTHAAPDSSARRRFLNEARTAAGLHHTHIVPVFDVGQVGGLCYYAMQRIEGSGLDRVVRHLRRTRPGDGGGSPSGGASPHPEASGTLSVSSISSRVGRLWVRVSSGWIRRQNRTTGPGRDGTRRAMGNPESPPSRHRPGDAGNDLYSQSGLTDSTASWGSVTRRREPRAGSDRTSGRAGVKSGVAASSMTGLSTPVTDPRRRDDEAPPFAPPRGSAFFRWVATVGLQAADALAHAHHQGVIHRDVKPSNLLIDAKGTIWVTDFGLARRLADPGLTHHDSLLGTPRYMSPEQARTGSIDGRTDVYSLGATLYELLTLRPPFDGKTAAELMDQIGQVEPTPPRNIDPRIPRDLETIVLKALAKRPPDRYATAGELAEDLARFLSHEPVKARRISPIGRLWRVARRHPAISIVTTTAAAIVLAIATFAYVLLVAERNDALLARDETQKALQREEEANLKTRDAMKENLLQTAKFVATTDVPDRRSRGLGLIRDAVDLELEPDLRAQFRDEAVRFLVLRDVESRPELATGRAHGLVFGPQGNRLATLSENEEELALWDVGNRRRVTVVSLRAGSSTTGSPDLNGAETLGGEPNQGGGSLSSPGSAPGRGPTRSGTATTGDRRPGRSMSLVGNLIAALLPDDAGVSLVDMVSGAPLRKLPRASHSVVGVFGEPTGQRLVTIEQAPDEAASDAMEGLSAWDPSEFRQYQVNLWDLDHLDLPPVPLPLTMNGPGKPPRAGTPARSIRPPLVAVSPDGRTIAVAPSNATWVRLYSAHDGKPKGGRPIETQTELSALALGPNDLLATAGGGTVRLYDLDNRTFLTSLTPSQNFTWLMRFSPQGMLALAGLGPIELWDPVAHSRVAVLPMSEQAGDLAFTPDGRTIAAAGRLGVTSVWTIQDSAARTQLSGFDTRPSSLAFRDDGLLAGGGWDGGVWLWRSGRCPEVCSPLSIPREIEPAAGRASSPSPATPRAAMPGSGPASPSTSSPSEPPTPNSSSPDPRRPGPKARGDGPRGAPTNRDHSSDRPTSLAFDAEGRLVLQDARGLRIWPAEPLSGKASPSHELSLPLVTRPWLNLTPLVRTSDGRIMAMIRSSAVFLWRAEAPDRLIPVIPPPSPVAGPTPAPAAGPAPSAAAASGLEATPVKFRAVQIAPGGDRLYLIEYSGLMRTWSLEGSSAESEVQARELGWKVPLPEGISGLALRRDGAVLAVADRTGTVTLLDTARRTVLGRINSAGEEAGSLLLALSFSPDGRSLAVGSQQGTISLWMVDQTQRPRLGLRLPGHHGLVTNLAFDAQGRRLASGGMDPLVEVWDLDLIRRELRRRGLAD